MSTNEPTKKPAFVATANDLETDAKQEAFADSVADAIADDLLKELQEERAAQGLPPLPKD
jgi:TolB-like protein